MAVEPSRSARDGAVIGRASRVSWPTGAVLTVLAANVALIVAGLVVVPEGRRLALWAGLAVEGRSLPGLPDAFPGDALFVPGVVAQRAGKGEVHGGTGGRGVGVPARLPRTREIDPGLVHADGQLGWRR